ncbi:MAG: hypothetical protein NTY61_01965 [Candidatus Parcubacteria bacterium]|nr:hypothetical protein [Candidatus Parcubacteria bacterium]
MPENKRLMFRQAIGKLLHRHGKEENSPADLFLNFVYLDFIYLIPKNEAVGMLGPLAEAVKKKLASKKEPGIIHSTLAVLLHFSPSREAYDAMSLLADGDDFVGEYLFMAIKILVKCEPTQTEAIVTRFKPRIAERFWITRHGEKKKLGHFWGTIQTTFSREEDVVVRNIILKFLSEQSY